MPAEDFPFQTLLDYVPPPLLVSQHPSFRTAVISPLTFQDKHLSHALLLRRILPLSDLLEILGDIVDVVTSKDLENARERNEAYNLEPGADHDRISSIANLADYYDDAYSQPSRTISSTSLLRPSLQEWDSLLVIPNQEPSRHAFSCASYVLEVYAGSLRTVPTDEELPQIQDLIKHTRSLVVWQMLAPNDDAVRLILDISPTASFIWTSPSTKSPGQTVTHGKPPDAPTMPWVDSFEKQDPQIYAGRVLRASTMRKHLMAEAVAPGRPRKTKSYRPQWPDYVQEAWCRAVERDTTFIVFHCGTHERIGIRHRESQTLYLSDPIEIQGNTDYTKIQLGLHLAAVQDAIQRIPLLKHAVSQSTQLSKPTSRPKRRRPLQDDLLPSTKRRKSAPLSEEELTSKLATTDHVLVQLAFHPYDSPIPSFFSRKMEGKPRRLKTQYPLQSCLRLTVTRLIGEGATGSVYDTLLTLGNFDEAVSVVTKFAYSVEQKARLVNEAAIYSRLAERGCPSVVKCFGLFRSVDDDAMLLVLEHGGTPLHRQPRFSHPEDERAVLVEGVLRNRILDSLRKVHEAGVVHRDLRPPNFLLDDEDNVHIIDFDRGRLDRSPSQQDREIQGLESLLAGRTLQVNRGYGSSRSTLEVPEWSPPPRPELPSPPPVPEELPDDYDEGLKLLAHGARLFNAKTFNAYRIRLGLPDIPDLRDEQLAFYGEKARGD